MLENDLAFPFALLVPNAKTIKAMAAARREKMVAVRSTKELFARLDADDQVFLRVELRLWLLKGMQSRS